MNAPVQMLNEDSDGSYSIKIKELDPLRIELQEGSSIAGCYQSVGEQFIKIPAGMAIKDNTIFWMPGVAYLGNYRLVLIIKDKDGRWIKKYLNVTIEPKYGKIEN